MGGVSGKRSQAVPPAGGIGLRRLTLLAVYFAERLLFLGVNIVMPLRLLGYHGSPLFYSLLGRYATREQILILAVALELAALLLIIGGAVDNRLYRLELLAGLGAGGVSAMLNGLLAARGPRAAAEKRWGLAPLADPCRPLLYTAAFLAPCCGWLPIGDYRTFIILVAAVLLALLWNFYRLGAPASATSPGEALPAGHNAALYVILPSIDTHLFGKDDINYWFSWYAVNMAALTLLERKGYHRRASGSAMTGLLLIAAAIIIIVCATGQVSLLLAVAIQTAGSHIAFGYLYQQALNVCYRGRMMLYLSLLSLAGALGDKFGRQKVLSITIIIMAVSTFCIGLIPSYASIGVAEYSPDSKRGFMGSWLDFGSIAGFVLGAGIVVLISSIVSEQNFLDWGWRIPFFLAAPLGIIGLYLRNALEETPTFQQHMDKMESADRETLKERPRLSVREVASKHWKGLLACVELVIAINVTYYMLLTYMPSYLSHNLHYSEDHGVLIIIAIMVGMLFVQPVVGLWSDKVGRKPFVIGGNIGLFILAIPCFSLINSNVLGLIFLGLLLLAVLFNAFIGVMALTLAAMFPTQIRYSALAISFNISVLIAGLTSTLTAWLVESTGNLYMPAYYLMVIAVIRLATGIFMRETADRAEAKEIQQERYDDIEQHPHVN